MSDGQSPTSKGRGYLELTGPKGRALITYVKELGEILESPQKGSKDVSGRTGTKPAAGTAARSSAGKPPFAGSNGQQKAAAATTSGPTGTAAGIGTSATARPAGTSTAAGVTTRTGAAGASAAAGATTATRTAGTTTRTGQAGTAGTACTTNSARTAYAAAAASTSAPWNKVLDNGLGNLGSGNQSQGRKESLVTDSAGMKNQSRELPSFEELFRNKAPILVTELERAAALKRKLRALETQPAEDMDNPSIDPVPDTILAPEDSATGNASTGERERLETGHQKDLVTESLAAKAYVAEGVGLGSPVCEAYVAKGESLGSSVCESYVAEGEGPELPACEAYVAAGGGLGSSVCESYVAEGEGSGSPACEFYVPEGEGLGSSVRGAFVSESEGPESPIPEASAHEVETLATEGAVTGTLETGSLETGGLKNESAETGSLETESAETAIKTPETTRVRTSLPETSLLNNGRCSGLLPFTDDILDKANLLEETLASFGVRAQVTDFTQGPTLTRFEVQPAPGVKVSRIVSLADDLALSLATADVRIEAPIPGKAAVGIEVPNREPAQVSLREILETKHFSQARSKLSVVLGRDIGGEPVVADLGRLLHLLIAGATGSGKSVCMNSLITSILYKARPHEVKFLMIDPKMVEFASYNGIPHLIAPVIVDPKQATAALRWVVTEMENRYNVFAGTGVRNLDGYNSQQKAAGGTALPQIVVFIDELADLMMVASRDVEETICRLAQKARAAGIHLVIATQRPSVDVITGIIKANIPSRIAFAVSSQVDSRTILDTSGAEKLLGRGDMLYSAIGASKPLRIQGAFVSDEEVGRVSEYWKTQAQPDYLEGVFHPENSRNSGVHAEEEDELLAEAASLVIDSGQASVSMLQRRFRIGYTRAARLIDLMEDKGFIGGFEGSKPREVLVTREDWDEIFG